MQPNSCLMWVHWKPIFLPELGQSHKVGNQNYFPFAPIPPAGGKCMWTLRGRKYQTGRVRWGMPARAVDPFGERKNPEAKNKREKSLLRTIYGFMSFKVAFRPAWDRGWVGHIFMVIWKSQSGSPVGRLLLSLVRKYFYRVHRVFGSKELRVKRKEEAYNAE